MDMNHVRWMVIVGFMLLTACEPKVPITVYVLDGGQLRTVVTDNQIPTAILTQAGVILGPADRVMLNGVIIPLDQPVPSSGAYTLQILRAVSLNINGKTIQSAAQTVGEALSDTGAPMYLGDEIDPPIDTLIAGAVTVNHMPSQDLVVTADGRQLHIRSNARTVGDALADAGLPLLGLDTSQPPENEPLPKDGQIHITRVSESVILAQKSIPFNSQFISSANVELDHQDVLQPGQPGLMVSRTRIRFEDGKEVSRQTEAETVVRAPSDRVVGYGTKVVIQTATVDGVQIHYWRAIQMFTTAYSPCNSGGSQCYPGTSSGKPVQKGVTAVRYSWYLNMQGQALYIPGYGFATIEDVCGGCVGKPWIDLGYTDAQYQQEGGQWGKYVTVYFLAPAPANILDVLQ
jgi:resuscitation-promoting factor RpfB